MPTNYEPLVLTIEPAYIGSAVSPTVDITETSDDVTVTITDFRGEHSYTVEKTDGAIADAEAAADNANAAATTAESAADNANTKAALADAAATAANTAAGNADDAASGARAATVDTQAATTAANTATNNANAATSTANTAAQNADVKAALANTAASNADAKAALASTAAANADAKATLADNAAASATSAAGDASAAATGANNAATAANTAAAAADTAREAIQDDLAAKADKDGYYPLLSAGTSDALLSGDSTVSTFAQRTSDHDSACRIDSLRGNTVVWNQLVNSDELSASSSVTNRAIDSVNHGITGNVASGATNIWLGKYLGNGTIKTDRKYLARCEVLCSTSGTVNPQLFGAIGTFISGTREVTVAPNIKSITSYIYSVTTININDDINDVLFRVMYHLDDSAAADIGAYKMQIFDLTAMFGAGNEPATVAEFEALFPDAYYPYNAGELVSVNVEGVKAVGFNRFDGNNTTPGKAIKTVDGQLASVAVCSASDYIECLPNTGYCTPESIGSLVYGVAFYDGSKQFISGSGQNAVNKIHTSPANARYLRFTILTANIDTTCINISNPALNGTYKPYAENVREIPASTYFPDGMRSAGSVYDELTGDKAITRVNVLEFTGNEQNAISGYTWSDYSGFTITNILPESSQNYGTGRFPYTSADFGISNGEQEPNTTQFAWAGVSNRSLYLLWANCPYSTADELKAWFANRYNAGNPVTFYLPYREQIETAIDPPLNLTYPTEQGGTESIVVPTGEQSAPPTLVTVYAYDADGIVDKSQSIVAPVEGARASANYSVGSYLVHDGTLYRVTTAIATGETINPGSNVTATTVMAELIRLTA